MTETTLRIKIAYDEWAEVYYYNENPTRDLNYKAIRKAPLELADKRVLEIGCGTGLNTVYLTQQARKVVGVDISEAMLIKARQRVKDKNVEFIKADITKDWQFREKSFDIIVANLLLEHIEDLNHVFSEVFNALWRKGKFYIAELHPYKQLQESQAKFFNPQTGKEVLVDALTHTVSEYVNKGIKTGFSLQKMREWEKEDEKIPRLLSLLFKK